MSLKDLEKQYSKDPKSRKFFPLAEEYAKIGQLEKAAEILRKGLIIHPTYISARVTLGRIMIQLGKSENARRELEKVIDLVPDNIMAHSLLGKVYEEKDLPEKALEQYSMVVLLNPTDEITKTRIQAIKSKLGIAAREKPEESEQVTKQTAQTEEVLEAEISFELPEESKQKNNYQFQDSSKEMNLESEDISFDLPDQESTKEKPAGLKEGEASGSLFGNESLPAISELLDKNQKPVADDRSFEYGKQDDSLREESAPVESEEKIRFGGVDEDKAMISGGREPAGVDIDSDLKPGRQAVPESSGFETEDEISFDLPDDNMFSLDQAVKDTAVEKKPDKIPVKETEDQKTRQDKIQTISLANIYFNQGYYERAEEILLEILKKAPQNKEAQSLLNKIQSLQQGEQVAPPQEEPAEVPWKEAISGETQKRMLDSFNRYLRAIQVLKKERGNQVR